MKSKKFNCLYFPNSAILRNRQIVAFLYRFCYDFTAQFATAKCVNKSLAFNKIPKNSKLQFACACLGRGVWKAHR